MVDRLPTIPFVPAVEEADLIQYRHKRPPDHSYR